MSVNTEVQGSGRGLDKIKWIVVAILVVIAIYGNYHYRDMGLLQRISGVTVMALAAAAIALTTIKGRETILFAREAQVEIRKVVWPTRQEALHTTLIVAVVTAVMSLILWGLDSLLVRLIAFVRF